MQLYQFVLSEIKGIHFAFAKTSEHEEEAKLLAERYSHCRTVPGTRSMHHVVPVMTSTVEALNVETLPLSTTKGHVTMMEIVGLDVSLR